MTIIHAFAPITKTEKGDDGFLRVYGMATGPQLDLDGQVCDPDWLKSAMPEWFETGANIREMHQPSAVGVGTELDSLGDDHWLTSKVVSPDAAVKVEQGVYTGYSIGIKSPKIVKDAAAPNGRIVGGKIIEVSLVDRPCNESAKLVLAKLAGASDELIHVEDDLQKDVGPLADSTIAGNAVDENGDPIDDGAEADEVDLLAAAQAAISALLVGEAIEVAEGTGSTGPVQILLAILEELAWFATCDSWDDQEAMLASMKAARLDSEEPMNLNKITSLVKAAGADDASDDTKAELAELVKALGLDEISVKLDTAMTQAATAEDLAKVADRLAKVETTVIDNGPARTAPAPNPALKVAEALIEKAAGFRHKAETVTDREMAAAYAQMANDLERQIASNTFA